MSGPARRLLHICYCCDNADPVTALFVGVLGFGNTMNTPLEPSDGAVLGVAGQITSRARFVVDSRGPRISPAIEIQEWASPKLVGRPSANPFEVGIKAAGFAVASVAQAVERLLGTGCALVASDEGFAVVTDPYGVTLELTGDDAVEPGSVRMHHLRVTVTDLETSLELYRRLGFEVLGLEPVTSARLQGGPESAKGRMARVVLADEPYELHLYEWRAPRSFGSHYPIANHAGIFRLALAVDDVAGAVVELDGSGWKVDRGPMRIALHGTPVPDLSVVFLSDPDGIPVELVERPRAAFR